MNRADIDGHGAREGLGVRCGRGAIGMHSGRIDDDVEAAECRDAGVDRVTHGGGHRHIGRNHRGAATGCVELDLHVSVRRFVDTESQHRSAAVGKPPGCREANARGAGDQCDLSLEVLHWIILLR